ncbi:MAG: type II toxin-antitoxin system mRNA interferase toxin, RelE/StbE family [Chloroflexi bacterium]|nr:type II toxin-antitoxin system mRNA interferase toxin, RelE/StbE family [Chloroflexota bacterium]
MDVSFASRFIKQFNKLPDKSQQRFNSRLKLFMSDQHHVLLRRHALKGKYAGYYSIDISGDLRAVFRYNSRGSVIFSLIGTHSQLY